MDLIVLNALTDNLVYLLHDSKNSYTAAVDPSEAEPVDRALTERGWGLDSILCTHHHADHTGGNLPLKKKYGANVIGPAKDEARIAGIDVAVKDGETFTLGPIRVTGLSVPGHTRGAMAYWIPDLKWLFTGDTLFLAGCGRLFEGSPADMWSSLVRLRALPPDTLIYCGHEYTEANLAFASVIDPENTRIGERRKSCLSKRSAGLPTVPGTMEEEKSTNPFLRADSNAVQAAMGMRGEEPVRVFARIREKKDYFRYEGH